MPTSLLDADTFHAPAVQPGSGDELRAAAAAIRAQTQPAHRDETVSALRSLRLSTVARNETQDEARASFAKLCADLADVPGDVLREACTRYTNAPGTRFFPRGAGEIRQFTNPIMRQRSTWSIRLTQMAELADNMFDESTRCPPDVAAAILAESGVKRLPIA